MALDLSFLHGYMPGKAVPRPASGTLSGHAAGEPFDKFVETRVAEEYPESTFRQYELLNAVLAAHPEAVAAPDRRGLLGPPALQLLLARGTGPMRAWTPDAPFEEKQDDTADVIVLDDASLDLSVGCLHLVDVKSHNLQKKGQPPNIISALKLANMSGAMIESGNFSSHDLSYVGVEWELDNDLLVCRECVTRELFQAPPHVLYINWAAGLQIQFHVPGLRQDWDGTIEEWCYSYLSHFVRSVDSRADKMVAQWADPFRGFIASN